MQDIEIDSRKINRDYARSFVIRKGGPLVVIDDIFLMGYLSREGANLQILAEKGIRIAKETELGWSPKLKENDHDPNPIGGRAFQVMAGTSGLKIFVAERRYLVTILGKGVLSKDVPEIYVGVCAAKAVYPVPLYYEQYPDQDSRVLLWNIRNRVRSFVF